VKTFILALLGLVTVGTLVTNGAVLKQSDVAFMYEAGRSTFGEYGATVLAWGGKPTAKARAEAEGVTWFGSAGMVTEFSACHRRFPDRYEEGFQAYFAALPAEEWARLGLKGRRTLRCRNSPTSPPIKSSKSLNHRGSESNPAVNSPGR